MIKKIKDNKILKVLFMGIKAIVTLFVVLVVSVIFVQRISNNKVTLGGYSIFGIVSESMLPKYEIGDMLIAKKVDPVLIKKGDDVVYNGKEDTFAGKIVTHRVNNIEYIDGKYYFHTQGISVLVEDPKISEDQVIGVIVYKTRILSLLSKLINSTYGFYFAIFVPFVIMLFFEIISVVNEKNK